MPINLKKLLTRTASASVLIPLTLMGIYFGGTPFLVMVMLCAFACAYEWSKLAKLLGRPVLFAIIGLLYITVSMYSSYAIREELSLELAFVFVVLIWSSDIGAYFTGKLIGGPKLAEKISPNKTWAGFAGAAFFPALCFFSWVLISTYLKTGAISDAGFALSMLLVGGFIGVVGQGGDILISYIKRKAQVKDTGDIIPGHGGILDRVDSLLLAAPVYFILMSVMSYE